MFNFSPNNDIERGIGTFKDCVGYPYFKRRYNDYVKPRGEVRHTISTKQYLAKKKIHFGYYFFKTEKCGQKCKLFTANLTFNSVPC